MAFAPIDQRSQDDVADLLGKLSACDQDRVVAAMRTIESVLGDTPPPDVPYILRPPRPGDMGWIVSRHGMVYGGEYGWDDRLEALTAEIVAAFVRNYDPRRERCWIAERDGENAGSVFIVKDSEEVARLRLLLVEPKARGLGIGARLVEEAVRYFPRCRLSQGHAVDPQRAHGGAAYLRAGGLQARRHQQAQRVRAGTGRGDLGLDL